MGLDFTENARQHENMRKVEENWDKIDWNTKMKDNNKIHKFLVEEDGQIAEVKDCDLDEFKEYLRTHGYILESNIIKKKG